MIERVVIGDGLLWTQGAHVAGSSVIEYPLTYPLVARDGSRPGEYCGEAVRETRDGSTFLRIGTTTDIYEFEIMPPTQEAIDYADGFILAHTQKRHTKPRGKSAEFVTGWLDGCRESKR